MSYTLFVAHSTDDENLLDALVASLTSLPNIDCYVAERRPEPDKFVIEKVEKHIRTSDAMVAFLTERGKASAFVNQEIGWARREYGTERPIIVFVERGVKLEAWLYGHDTIEFDEDSFDEKVSELRDFVEGFSADKESKAAFHPEETEPRIQERRIEEKPSYTLLELSDQSHALAKRYSANLLIDGRCDEDNVRGIIRSATNYIRKQDYYRNAAVRARWGKRDAQVVWLFVYCSLADVVPVNWVARSLWIESGLPPESRPQAFVPDEELDGILVDWNERHKELQRFWRERTLTKGDYLSQVDGIVEVAQPLLERATQILNAHEDRTLSDGDLIRELQALGQPFARLDMATGDLGFPPPECAKLDNAFQGLMGHAANFFLFFSPKGIEQWDERARLYLAGRSHEAAQRELRRFRTIRQDI